MARPTSDEAIDATIAAIESEIEALRRTRETLLRMRNKPVGDATIGGSSSSGQPTSPAPVIEDAMTAVREQEFSGMAATQAARVFLQRIGRNEKTPVILAAIQKGGVQVGGVNKIGRLYTALARHSAFVALGKNYWDLAERRPDLAQEKKQQRLGGSKRKRKKPGPKPGSKRVMRLAPDQAASA